MHRLLASLGALLLLAAATMPAGNAQAPQSEDRAPEQVASDSDGKESADIRAARAHVKLAKLDLERALEVNERFPGLYSEDHFEQLRVHLEIDEAHLQECLEGFDGDAHDVCVHSSEASLRMAEFDLARRRDVYRRSGAPVAASSVERAEIVAEIARINLEMARDLDSESTYSVITHLQRQIDQLRHEMLELKMWRAHF